jgi:hypothetical protein
MLPAAFDDSLEAAIGEATAMVTGRRWLGVPLLVARGKADPEANAMLFATLQESGAVAAAPCLHAAVFAAPYVHQGTAGAVLGFHPATSMWFGVFPDGSAVASEALLDVLMVPDGTGNTGGSASTAAQPHQTPL